MRTSKVTINGKEYLACFSTRVLIDIEERYGNWADGLKEILKEDNTPGVFWLLARLIDAGNRYAKIEEIENPGTLSEDDLIDSTGVHEYKEIFKSVYGAVSAGSTPTIQTKPTKESKNENATSQAG